MNASMMLIAFLTGADAAPLVAAPAAPAAAHAHGPAIVSGHGCSDCAPACDSCAPACKPGLLDRLRGLRHRSSSCCEPVTDHCCGKPIFTGFTTAACDSCCEPACKSPGLLERLRARFHKSDCCDPCAAAPSCCGATPVSGCALPPVPGTVAPAAPTEAPKEMPKPAAPAATPKSTGLDIPQIVQPVSGGQPSIPVLVSPASKF